MAEVLKLISKSSKGTKKIGRILGEALRKETVFLNKALIIGLQGNLGAGKTTFVRGLAEGLGVKEKVKSPSFAIMKIFEIPGGHKKDKFNHFFHFDFYRLEELTRKELKAFNFFEFLKNPQNLIIAEWSEKIKKFLPKPRIEIKFEILKPNTRELKFIIE